MSFFFDAKTNDLDAMQKAGVSPFDEQMTAWVDDYAQAILTRIFLPYPHHTAVHFQARIVHVLFRTGFLPYPYRADGGPAWESDADYYRLLRTGNSQLRDLFHALANVGSPGGDAVTSFTRGVLIERAEELFCRNMLVFAPCPDAELTDVPITLTSQDGQAALTCTASEITLTLVPSATPCLAYRPPAPFASLSRALVYIIGLSAVTDRPVTFLSAAQWGRT